MALVNHAKREINAKIVYYGPEQSGKSTSLRFIYDRIKPTLRGELKSLPASGATLLFFDFSPFEQTQYGGYRIRLHIYTLQGPVTNPAAWKMTLKGADGLVLVVDPAPDALESNRQSVQQLREYLNGYGMALQEMPCVLQVNKSDLCRDDVTDSIAARLGLADCSTVAANALSGKGVLEGLTLLSSQILERIREREDCGVSSGAFDVDDQRSEQAGLPNCDNDNPGMAFSDIEAGTVGAVREVGPGPVVKVNEGAVLVEGQSVSIPLDIETASGRQSLVVTVTISSPITVS